jgi:hypothetical protein
MWKMRGRSHRENLGAEPDGWFTIETLNLQPIRMTPIAEELPLPNAAPASALLLISKSISPRSLLRFSPQPARNTFLPAHPRQAA